MKRTFLTIVLALCFCLIIRAGDTLRLKPSAAIATAARQCGIAPIDHLLLVDSTLILGASSREAVGVAYRRADVERIYQKLTPLMPTPEKWTRFEVQLKNYPLEAYVPFDEDSTSASLAGRVERTFGAPLVTPLSRPAFEHGLVGHHIALWQSHGRYYEQSLDRWEWQRGRLLQTVEDLYTQSYVLPFLVPMLENAGANVLMPRERDWQTQEIIVDRDGGHADSHGYDDGHGWHTGEGPGFAYLRAMYINNQNPFTEGHYRQVQATTDAGGSEASWTPHFDESGRYAVYVSYKSLPTSATDALYTVHHQGGATQFRVNQRMGGGTWIYLGTFLFAKGRSHQGRVTLSSCSADAGALVTADAVKFGGGMGNVGRGKSAQWREEGADENILAEDEAFVSEAPRFCEAARYWLQWAGVPDSVYNLNAGKNDYPDDYKCRGRWVNWLAGGSGALPSEGGLGIPIDLSFAFHTDAGITKGDGTIGTLAIYDAQHYGGRFPGGASRILNRHLSDLVQTAITSDVRALHNPRWNRRQMWDASYFEAWSPQVPAMLLELLSHQNFADMRYGLDPRFRFTVSRAIYKGMLRFLCANRGVTPVVQPLPVKDMALQPIGSRRVLLSWSPTIDSLEASAMPTRYVVYQSTGDRGWDNGTLCDSTSMALTITEDAVHRFRVVAMNDGGLSFPSETLSAGVPRSGDLTQGSVMIVNGFTRVSAPADMNFETTDGRRIAGFLDQLDHGVPYLEDICYVGSQKNFGRENPWVDDDASGFGDSYGDQEYNVIGGNTFDYPSVHGSAVLSAGRPFVSASRAAVEGGRVDLCAYPVVDLILGKQYQTRMGDDHGQALEFKSFTPAMQTVLRQYTMQGGSVMVTGAFVGSDLWNNRYAPSLEADKAFARQVLGYVWRTDKAARTGKLFSPPRKKALFTGRYTYQAELSPNAYVIENPDAIEPSSKAGQTVLRYTENNLSAAIWHKGSNYRTFVMGVPFESITEATQRQKLMKQILQNLWPRP